MYQTIFDRELGQKITLATYSDEELKVYVQLSPTVSHQLPFDQGVHAHQSGL